MFSFAVLIELLGLLNERKRCLQLGSWVRFQFGCVPSLMPALCLISPTTKGTLKCANRYCIFCSLFLRLLSRILVAHQSTTCSCLYRVTFRLLRSSTGGIRTRKYHAVTLQRQVAEAALLQYATRTIKVMTRKTPTWSTHLPTREIRMVHSPIVA